MNVSNSCVGNGKATAPLQKLTYPNLIFLEPASLDKFSWKANSIN